MIFTFGCVFLLQVSRTQWLLCSYWKTLLDEQRLFKNRVHQYHFCPFIVAIFRFIRISWMQWLESRHLLESFAPCTCCYAQYGSRNRAACSTFFDAVHLVEKNSDAVRSKPLPCTWSLAIIQLLDSLPVQWFNCGCTITVIDNSIVGISSWSWHSG